MAASGGDGGGQGVADSLVLSQSRMDEGLGQRAAEVLGAPPGGLPLPLPTLAGLGDALAVRSARYATFYSLYTPVECYIVIFFWPRSTGLLALRRVARASSATPQLFLVTMLFCYIYTGWLISQCIAQGLKMDVVTSVLTLPPPLLTSTQAVDAERAARASLGGFLSFTNVLVGISIVGILATLHPLITLTWRQYVYPAVAPLLRALGPVWERLKPAAIALWEVRAGGPWEALGGPFSPPFLWERMKLAS